MHRRLPLFGSLLLAACAGPADSPEAPVAAAVAIDERIVTPIHAVQGRGATSPLVGKPVTVQGIVTGDFQSGDAHAERDLGGFFLQEEYPDADPLTSEGIFVADAARPLTDVAVGDRVTVTGVVAETAGESRIVAVELGVAGRGSMQPVALTWPAANALDVDGDLVPDLEAFEGMLVSITVPLLVSDLHDLERFGEIALAYGGRPYQFTNGNPPDVAAYAEYRRQLATRTLLLDDGTLRQNPAHTGYHALRAGDAVAGLVGNLRYGRGSRDAGPANFRLEPAAAPQFLSVNARPDTPPETHGRIRVASFNVMNFFTTIDTGLDNCGPSGDMGCRGADSSAEFARQRARLLLALRMLDADIVGLLEVENNGGGALASLVEGLNAATNERTWSYVPTGIVGSDAITAGLIFNTATVRTVGEFATLTTADDARFIDRRNRPVIAQTFARRANGARFTVVVNHLKSKGSPCDDLQDPDRQDGQGNCNGTRTNAALAMLDWIARDPTGSGDPDVLVIGDLNAYPEEDPVTAFTRAGYADLLATIIGRFAYTYTYAGQIGALDHAFASPSMAAQVTGAAAWHINADEPPLLDYNLEFGRDAGWFDAQSPYRASDHDPVIIGLDPTR